MPGCRRSPMSTHTTPTKRTAHPAGPRAGADRDRAARARGVELRAGAHRAARSPVSHTEGSCACGTRHYVRPGCGTEATKACSASTAPNTIGCADWSPRRSPHGRRARLQHTIVDVITELVDPLTSTGRCDVVADIARRYPIPIICGLLGAPRQDWQLFSAWADDIFKLFNWNVANDASGHPGGLGRDSTPTSTT